MMSKMSGIFEKINLRISSRIHTLYCFDIESQEIRMMQEINIIQLLIN